MTYDFDREMAIELSLETQGNPPRKDQSALQHVHQQLSQPGAIDELTGNAKEGNRHAQRVIDTYKILRHRRDPAAEQFVIVAWQQYSHPVDTSTQPLTPAVRHWIEAERQAYSRSNHPAVSPATTMHPWQYIPFLGEDSPRNHTVWGAAGPPSDQVAQMVTNDHQGPDLGDEQLEANANGSLIENAAVFTLQLDHSQLVILESMNLISRGDLPALSGLHAEGQILDELLDPIGHDLELSTHGPWTYKPEDFAVYAGKPNNEFPIAYLGRTDQHYSTNQLRHIQANAQLITAVPELASQLRQTRHALDNARHGLEVGMSVQVFNELHKTAVANDPILRAARGQSLNPHNFEPLPGTPAYERWIDANLAMIAGASAVPRHTPQQANTYLVPEQQSGIYQGTIAAVSKEFYFQHRSDDSLVAHWKGSFNDPLVAGQQCVISYRQQKATVRQVAPQLQAVTTKQR